MKLLQSPALVQAAYCRHEPQETLFYQTIQQSLQKFVDQCAAASHPVPRFVQNEFEAYLECGILAHGFARIYCKDCRFNRLVAFSCKKRGFCPSCISRRMSDTAAHLVEAVIPNIPTCQWVLSVPAPLRYLIAYDSTALNVVVSAFSKTVFQWLRRKTNIKASLSSLTKIHPGAITFVQRFGSALNLNTHFHSIFSAGAYIENASGAVTFSKLPNPTLQEIVEITTTIANRVHSWLQERMDELEYSNEFYEKEPLLASCYAASIRYLTALGKQAGQPLLKAFSHPPESKSSRQAHTVAGFNLHVSKPIQATDRRGLERQLRYMGRPPLSDERLSKTADGRLVVKLKTSWSDGTSHVVLTQMEFMERLVALIPPPRKNQVRYQGFFASNARIRKLVVPKKKLESQTEEQGCCTPRRLKFAKLMARVFEIDVLKCPRCQSQMQVISFVTESKAIKDILTSLKMSTAPPLVTPSGEPKQVEIIYDYADMG
jgi:hypothetical protein